MSCSGACCQNVNDLDNTFGEKEALKDAEHYLRHGLNRRNKKLIAPMLAWRGAPLEVLEIGCGAGMLHHELLRRGIASFARGVDAASGQLTAAKRNAEQLGLMERTAYFKRDFAQSPEEFASADIVLLDRVVCCYPYLEQLFSNAAQRTRRFLAVSLPIDPWWAKAAFVVLDKVLTLFGSGYHPYLHSHAALKALACAAGLSLTHTDREFIWQIYVFERTGTN